MFFMPIIMLAVIRFIYLTRNRTSLTNIVMIFVTKLINFLNMSKKNECNLIITAFIINSYFYAAC